MLSDLNLESIGMGFMFRTSSEKRYTLRVAAGTAFRKRMLKALFLHKPQTGSLFNATGARSQSPFINRVFSPKYSLKAIANEPVLLKPTSSAMVWG